jgi:hypothetical protein
VEMMMKKSTISQLLDRYYYDYNFMTAGRDKIEGFIIVDGKVNCIGDGYHITFNPIDNLKAMPIKFGEVHGSFICSGSNLITLKGSPDKVMEKFNCRNNLIESLVGGPRTVDGLYNASDNTLKSLDGLPESVKFLSLDVYPTLPILKLLTVQSSVKHPFRLGSNSMSRILNQYLDVIKNGTPMKKAMWECQKSLIDAGFEGNARW